MQSQCPFSSLYAVLSYIFHKSNDGVELLLPLCFYNQYTFSYAYQKKTIIHKHRGVECGSFVTS